MDNSPLFSNVWFLNALAMICFPVWMILFWVLLHPKVFVLNTMTVAIWVIITVFVHEFLHYAAIKMMNRHVQASFGFRYFNPCVRAVGNMSTADRIVFNLTPFFIITMTCWVISSVFPLSSVTCLIIASFNASGSTSDVVRAIQILQGV